MLTALMNEIDGLSLHNGDPGDGSQNEISGGGYSRPAVTSANFSGPTNGELMWASDMELDGEAEQAVDHIVFWANGAAVARGQLAGSNQFNSEGKFTIVEGSILSIENIVE